MNDELGAGGAFIVRRSAFIVLFGSALVAKVIVPEVLFRRRLGQTADAVVLPRLSLQFARRRLVIHGRGVVVARNARLFCWAGGHDDSRSQGRGARAFRSWLAGYLAHLLVRRLLRSGEHGLSRAARDQRGSRGARRRLRAARTSRHGD